MDLATGKKRREWEAGGGGQAHYTTAHLGSVHAQDRHQPSHELPMTPSGRQDGPVYNISSSHQSTAHPRSGPGRGGEGAGVITGGQQALRLGFRGGNNRVRHSFRVLGAVLILCVWAGDAGKEGMQEMAGIMGGIFFTG